MLTGTAEANSTISIFDGTTLLGTTTADALGSWTFTPTTALIDGSHSLTATATDAAGNVSTASSAFTLTVDTAAPATPVIGTVTDAVAPVTGTITAGGSTNDANRPDRHRRGQQHRQHLRLAPRCSAPPPPMPPATGPTRRLRR
ncbi:Ig-like domain-containing protein [Ralstonia pseudosolanacearum]|uniref:Ig-like domain-containing protein n=1 Tax=Ralstonia pseudosolanacearum TaxID=1310165 RepID=UPI002E1B9F18